MRVGRRGARRGSHAAGGAAAAAAAGGAVVGAAARRTAGDAHYAAHCAAAARLEQVGAYLLNPNGSSTHYRALAASGSGSVSCHDI